MSAATHRAHEPHQPHRPGPPRRGRRAGRAGAGLPALLAVLAVAAVSAAPALTPAPAEAAAPGGRALSVRVDPERCTAPASGAAAVVCRPEQAGPLLADGGTLVLSGVRHDGAVDLRGRSRVRVVGEPGAVLDAAGGRYALAVRDSADVRVESLGLAGGTAQTVWVERSARVALRGVEVRDGAGAGVQVRDTRRFSLTDSVVRDAAGAGVMELTGVTDSAYRRLAVTGNGHGPEEYNGDGLQLAGTRVQVRDVTVTGNGSSPVYEHGVYVASGAQSVLLSRVTSRDNSGVAVKLGGSGRLESSRLTDDRIALYCGPTAGRGWTVRGTRLTAPTPQRAEPTCRLAGPTR